MNIGETQKIAYSGEGETLRHGEFTAGKNVGNIVIAQPGLGSTCHTSSFLESIRKAVMTGANFSLFAVDHPCYGLNTKDHIKEFSLPKCIENTQLAIRHILKNNPDSSVILAGNSLSFYLIFQSLRNGIEDDRIRGFLGKSGIISYKNILNRMLQSCGKDWEELLKKFNKDSQGMCTISVNELGAPVTIHENFLYSIEEVSEDGTIPIHIECWHGEKDKYSNYSDMQRHNGGNITVHVVPGVGHNLSAGPGDDTPHRVHREMIERIEEIFAESGN